MLGSFFEAKALGPPLTLAKRSNGTKNPSLPAEIAGLIGIALMYENGIGGPPDSAKAQQLLQQVIDSSDPLPAEWRWANSIFMFWRRAMEFRKMSARRLNGTRRLPRAETGTRKLCSIA